MHPRIAVRRGAAAVNRCTIYKHQALYVQSILAFGNAARFRSDCKRRGHGATLSAGTVTTAPGWAEAYRAFVDGGWNGLAASYCSG